MFNPFSPFNYPSGYFNSLRNTLASKYPALAELPMVTLNEITNSRTIAGNRLEPLRQLIQPMIVLLTVRSDYPFVGVARCVHAVENDTACQIPFLCQETKHENKNA